MQYSCGVWAVFILLQNSFLEGIWISEAENPDSLGGVATELLNIPEEDFEVDWEKGMILLRQWSTELFMSTPLTLDDIAGLEDIGDAK